MRSATASPHPPHHDAHPRRRHRPPRHPRHRPGPHHLRRRAPPPRRPDDQLLQAVDDARINTYLGPTALDELLLRCPRLNGLIGPDSGPSRSKLERAFKRFAKKYSLPPYGLNVPLHGYEVALEATTGWRFMVEELRWVGASVHLAEPAETSNHHGLPKRTGLLTGENRAWIGQLALPAAGREQITVAPWMIAALEVRIVPLDKELRAYARRQAGCRALQGAHYGIGALTSVVILAELADCSRFSSSREAVRYGAMDPPPRRGRH